MEEIILSYFLIKKTFFFFSNKRYKDLMVESRYGMEGIAQLQLIFVIDLGKFRRKFFIKIFENFIKFSKMNEIKS